MASSRRSEPLSAQEAYPQNLAQPRHVLGARAVFLGSGNGGGIRSSSGQSRFCGVRDPGRFSHHFPRDQPRRHVSPSRTPMSSPGKHGDRFIPSRSAANWDLKFHRTQDSEKSLKEKRPSRKATWGSSPVYSALLSNELLGAGIERVHDAKGRGQRLPQPRSPEKENLFVYSPSTEGWRRDEAGAAPPYGVSPVSSKSRALLASQKKTPQSIPAKPFKILEAPELRDNFCLNLLDWSSLNIISVGLGTSVFLWHAATCQVMRVCDLAVGGDSVTSVCWSQQGSLLAVGTQKGFVQVWDVVAERLVCVLDKHGSRVSVLAWNADQISSGSRDKLILQRDLRTRAMQSRRCLQGHSGEVCGLKWSTNHRLLASSGKDNTVVLWTPASPKPVQQHTGHRAAVKAIAWSPHQHGLLASGGSQADRAILFWNTLTNQTLQSIHTGSQVCNLAWSRHSNELVSTHGAPENQIVIWKYPSLTQANQLTGHACRVSHLTMSPDGQVIATGASDETLRLWKVFNKTHPSRPSESTLDLFTRIR
ncbi:fizzy-related protein homolog, partial [Gracilinanus agilis]|uniref:fizzy-related protein homolog n=1 Tax=Gracilinanus agilis TaxID=191870 RepID=UPI001CFDEA9C